MSIPDYQELMLPILQLCSDGELHTLPEAVQHLASEFNLGEEERKRRLPSGRMTVIYNRTGWARTYLAKAKLLDAPSRGKFRITDRGREVLASPSAKLDSKFLERYDEFQQFKRASRPKISPEFDLTSTTKDGEKTPEEVLEESHQQLRKELAEELLTQIKSADSEFFERLVVELLLKMGYGGSRQDAGEAIGQSGDGGVDGIIKEDRLGLDVIYIQAKRWENTVGRPEIQKFVGALSGMRARKGVFITSSNYSREAIEYARAIDSKVILIDGDQLADLMIDFDLGVSTTATYYIKEVDTDYFSDT